MNPPTWAKNATAPPFAWALNSPKSASMSWYKNQSPRKIQAGIRTRNDRDLAPERRLTAEAFQGLCRGCCRRTGPGVGFSRVAASRTRRGRRT